MAENKSENSDNKGSNAGLLGVLALIVGTVAGAGGMYGYSSMQNNDAGAMQTTSLSSSDMFEEERDPNDKVVATVDGNEIYESDVMRFIKAQNIEASAQNISAIYPLALEQVIRGQVVLNRSEKAGLENDPEVIKQSNWAKKQIINTVFLNQTVDSRITDDIVQKTYDEYIAELPDVEERRARHILLDSEAKAKDAIAKIKAGSNFEDVAMEMSMGPTGPTGGDLGYFTADRMVPEFAQAAFKMNKGDVSSTPVKTQYGFHVIKVEDIRNQPKPSLEEMRNYIVVQLRQEILNELIDEWQTKTKIVKLDSKTEENPVEPAAGIEEAPADTPAEQTEPTPAPTQE